MWGIYDSYKNIIEDPHSQNPDEVGRMMLSPKVATLGFLNAMNKSLYVAKGTLQM